MDIRSLVAGLAVATGAVLPASASAATFGPDLGPLPANDSPEASCAFGIPLLGAPSSQSCMWSSGGTAPSSLLTPASGTVTAVRVKVGEKTGPMRVNVIRFLFRQTGDLARPFSAGPFLEAYGPEFTPAPDSVTTVATNLPVRVDPTPDPTDQTTIQVLDGLALEVRAPDVPIPVFASAGALSYPVYPGPTEQGIPAPSPNGLASYSTTGFGVLMNADLDTSTPGRTPPPGNTPLPPAGGAPPPAGAAPPAPAAGPPGPAAAPRAPSVAIRPGAIRVRGNVAAVPIECSGARCAGRMTLRKPGKRRVVYGSAPFSANADSTAIVDVKLNRRGRAALRRGAARAVAQVSFSAGGAAGRSFDVKLRRSKG